MDSGLMAKDATGAARRRSDRTSFLELPAAAQVYVVVVSALGIVSLAVSIGALRTNNWQLFTALLALAIMTSAIKIELPLGRGASNLSLAHVVNFWSLLALGAMPTVWIAAVGAAAQSTLRTHAANPPHRVIFSI